MSNCSFPRRISFGRLRVAGDGSCFFRSLAQALAVAYRGCLLEEQAETSLAKTLRHRVVTCLADNPGIFEWIKSINGLEDTDNVITPNISFSRYIDHMKKHRTYATHIEVMLAAKLFDLRICLMSNIEFDHEGTIIYVGSSHNLGKIMVNDNRGRRIFLHKEGLHYEPLIPKSVMRTSSRIKNIPDSFAFLHMPCDLNISGVMANNINTHLQKAMNEINRLKSSRTPLATQLANLTKLRNSINHRGARTLLNDRLYNIKRDMGKFDVSNTDFKEFVETLHRNNPNSKKYVNMIDQMMSNKTKRLTNNQRAILNVLKTNKQNENRHNKGLQQVRNMFRNL